MIDDLFNSIIKKILAMPKLVLKAESRNEFIQRCGRITFDHELTLHTFKHDFVLNPNTIMSSKEKYALEAYVAVMCDIAAEINFFITILSYAGNDKLGKEMDTEILTPLLYKLLPRDPLTLLQLQQTLDVFLDVNKPYRYFFDFKGIVDFLIESPQEPALSADELRVVNKIETLLMHLRNKEYYSWCYLLLKISNMSVRRMRECYDAIYLALAANNIHDFDNDAANMRDIDPEKLYIEKESILQMLSAKDHPFLAAHPEVWTNIKKYISYQEFHGTLWRITGSVFDKLREFVYKYPHFEADLEKDLDAVHIAVPENVRTYFYPARSYTASLLTLSFLWSDAYETKIPLRDFMDAFSKKIKAVEAAEDEKLAAEQITPPATPA